VRVSCGLDKYVGHVFVTYIRQTPLYDTSDCDKFEIKRPVPRLCRQQCRKCSWHKTQWVIIFIGLTVNQLWQEHRESSVFSKFLYRSPYGAGVFMAFYAAFVFNAPARGKTRVIWILPGGKDNSSRLGAMPVHSRPKDI